LLVVDRDRAPASPPALEPSFERFAARASPLLLRTAFLLIGDHGHAEDLLQTTLWRVFRNWNAVHGSPEGYAYRVLVNLSRDRKRGVMRRVIEQREVEASDAVCGDQLQRLLDRDAMTGLVRSLPRRQREVIALRFFLDLSVSETARALRMSDGAVKAYTSRALARLRQLDPSYGMQPKPLSIEAENAH
jgi:RNA polymerase sigma-70 factor (sigma-E family)